MTSNDHLRSGWQEHSNNEFERAALEIPDFRSAAEYPRFMAQAIGSDDNRPLSINP